MAVPNISARKAIKTFKKFGFKKNRQTGSHVILKKPNHTYALSVPDHGAKPLKKGTLRSLISDAGLTVKEFTDKM